MIPSPTGAVYLSSDASPSTSAQRKKPKTVFFSAVLAFVTLLLALTPFTSSQPEPLQAEAGPVGIFCSDKLGMWMEPGGWEGLLRTHRAPDVSGRTITAQEAFGANMSWPAYHGEGEGDFFSKEVEEGRLNIEGSEAKQRVQDIRTTGNCVLGSLANGAGTTVLMGAGFVASVTSSIAGFAFNTNIICEEPGQGGNCFDLLSIIGGHGGQNEGVIGALTSSIYVPLLTLIGLVAAVWLGWTGIVQRKLREALWGFVWVVTSVILGLAFLLNPALLAKAPMAVSNTVAGCVISAFGGNNCLSGAPQQQVLSSSDVCKTAPGRAPLDEQMGLIVEGLTCQVWKAFVLEPYSQGAFGQSFEAMDTRNPGTALEQALEDSGEDADKFCVGLTLPGTRTLANSEGRTLELTGDSVCNVVLYQLYLKTNASFNGGGPDAEVMEEHGIDSRWGKVVNLSANSDAFWSYWPASADQDIRKVGVGGLALLSALLGGLVIIVVAVFAVMYYVSAIFLTAFAPLFFLIGVHPGRGRDILKGYGEMVISNVLKYIASALFLVVTIALYGGVLGNSQSMGTTLLFVLVMSLALFMYRKEIVELLGRADMGGKQLSSGLGNKLGAMGKSSARFGAVALGSATGAKLAGGSAMGGMKDGMTRELKSGRVPVLGELPGIGDLSKQAVAGAARGADAVSNKHERELRDASKDADSDAKDAVRDEQIARSEYASLEGDFTSTASQLSLLEASIEKLREELDGGGPEAILDRMAAEKEGGEQFAEAARIGGAISILDKRIGEAQEQGLDTSDLMLQRDQLAGRRQELSQELKDAGLFEGLRNHYNSEVGEYNSQVRELDAQIASYNELSAGHERIGERLEDARDRVVAAAGAAHSAQAMEETLSTALRGVSQGTVITAKKRDRLLAEGEELGNAKAAAVTESAEASLQAPLEKHTKQEFERLSEAERVLPPETNATETLAVSSDDVGLNDGLPVAPAGGKSIADQPGLPIPTGNLRKPPASKNTLVSGDTSAPEPAPQEQGAREESEREELRAQAQEYDNLAAAYEEEAEAHRLRGDMHEMNRAMARAESAKEKMREADRASRGGEDSPPAEEPQEKPAPPRKPNPNAPASNYADDDNGLTF